MLLIYTLNALQLTSAGSLNWYCSACRKCIGKYMPVPTTSLIAAFHNEQSNTNHTHTHTHTPWSRNALIHANNANIIKKKKKIYY